jgi:hypothetical protein
MAENVDLERGVGLHRRIEIFVCVALAILFLYNPFLALTPSSNVLNVNHSLSYRTTLASSELQHFSPPDARKIFATPIAVVSTWLASPLNFLVGPAAEVSTQHLRAFQLVCADLWFRPPPAN